MPLPEISLAASAREWSDRLHRFVLDHGGAIVRGRVMSDDQAMHVAFDVLLIDDICSFLTPRLVGDLRRQGKAVVGVFDHGDGSDAKRRLLEAGISDVIESDAPPDEFIRVCLATVAHRDQPAVVDAEPRRQGLSVGVTGPPGGVGVTEVACALGMLLSKRRSTALLDANQAWPGISQRLNLPVHPNLMTAADLVMHEPERLDAALNRLGPLRVICGLANSRLPRLSAGEVGAVLEALSESHEVVIVDLGAVPEALTAAPVHSLDVVLVVGAATPSGVTRLLRAHESLVGSIGADREVALVVNRVGRSLRQHDEIALLLGNTVDSTPVVMVPDDRRVSRWSWDGEAVGRGPFERSVRKLASILEQGVDDG